VNWRREHFDEQKGRTDDDSMMMCLLSYQDDDSMMSAPTVLKVREIQPHDDGMMSFDITR